jgi:hypothetical protein
MVSESLRPVVVVAAVALRARDPCSAAAARPLRVRSSPSTERVPVRLHERFEALSLSRVRSEAAVVLSIAP